MAKRKGFFIDDMPIDESILDGYTDEEIDKLFQELFGEYIKLWPVTNYFNSVEKRIATALRFSYIKKQTKYNNQRATHYKSALSFSYTKKRLLR